MLQGVMLRIPPERLTAADIEVIRARFWVKVSKDGPIPKRHPELGPCWLWTAAKSKSGYGCFQYFHKCYRTHRLSWFLATGDWPNPLALHHCDVKACVRLSHLYEGSAMDNHRDMVAAGTSMIFHKRRMLKKYKDMLESM
jgi:hypothetical protein